MQEQDRQEPVTSNRPTLELCGDQLHRGLSCILDRGHAGDHECHSIHAGRVVRWQRGELQR